MEISVKKLVLLVSFMLFGCVQEADLLSWEGQPVASLDLHPFFATLPVEIKIASNGTEMRNYVNGLSVDSCFSNARINAAGSYAIYGTGSSFCSTRFKACNNIFYIRDGKVLRYTSMPSGGAICMTDQRVRPVAPF